MTASLPRSVQLNGVEYAVRTNFRDILTILQAFNDPDLEPTEKVFVCLFIFYEDFYALSSEAYETAYREAVRFIDHGIAPDEKAQKSPRVMDWEQDAPLLFPAINKVAGRETRAESYIHWWTFLGYYMEITEGIFSTVLHIRLKKQKRQKLEKWEAEFFNANQGICKLKKKESAETRKIKARLNALLGD